jgi:replicative DNA helicase
MNNETLFNLNIERGLLSALLFEPQLLETTKLTSEDFYLPFHNNLFTALKSMKHRGVLIDENFLIKEMKKSGTFSKADFDDLLGTLPLSNFEAYEGALKEASEKRNIMKLFEKVRGEIENYSPSEIRGMLQQNIDEETFDTLPPIQSTKNIEGKPPKFFLEEVLPIQEKEITMLTGSGGGGKSYTALYIGALLKKVHNHRVFAYLSEDSIYNTKYRLETLRRKHPDINEVDIDIWGKESRPQAFLRVNKDQSYSPTEYWYQFKNKLKNYDSIILDPLIAFVGVNENSNTEARQLFNLLNQWCETEDKQLMIIHHHGKDDKARGASAFVDAVRMHYSLKKEEGDNEIVNAHLEKTNHFIGSGSGDFSIPLFKNTAKKEAPKETSSKNVPTEKVTFQNNATKIIIQESRKPTEDEVRTKALLEKKGFRFE